MIKTGIGLTLMALLFLFTWKTLRADEGKKLCQTRLTMSHMAPGRCYFDEVMTGLAGFNGYVHCAKIQVYCE